jgi:hypothetical protein
MEYRPRNGLCIVCPYCDAILESLHLASYNEDWSFEDGDEQNEDICFTKNKERPR